MNRLPSKKYGIKPEKNSNKNLWVQKRTERDLIFNVWKKSQKNTTDSQFTNKNYTIEKNTS